MADRREAARLWGLICQLEKEPCKSEADFNSKKSEMAKLREAYSKATGTACNPRDLHEQRAKGDAQLLGQMGLRGTRPDAVTADDLNAQSINYEKDGQ